jgi:hypothetical protein
MKRRFILLSILLSIPLAARGQVFQANDRDPGHENDTVEIRPVEPVLVCSPDMSCVAFNDTVRPVPDTTPDSSPIVTAPSGGARFLIGAQTGSSFGNLFAGILAGVELPVTRHLELDLHDTFSPVEQHVPYGNGTANQVIGGGIVWINRSVGLNGQMEYSSYRVAGLSKAGDYVLTGITLRKTANAMPLRLSFDYLREVNNGISQGTESPRLQGGQFNLDMRVACHLAFCVRVQFDFKVGRVLQQSNPVCDGTYGITGGPGGGPCYRTAASSGAFTGAVLFEFPRRRATEQLAF